jgi:GLPGLI family protein
MKKIFIFFLFFCLVQNLFGQKSGRITFERKQYWINIYSKLPFATKEDIEREMLTWGKEQGKYIEKYELTFRDSISSYIAKEREENYGYSWVEDEYIVTRNYPNKTCKDFLTLLGKDYVLEGDSPKYKWKILNEIKEIQGYLCMKAETTDPIKQTKITAWFCDKIPVQGGPEGLTGLPGMILGVEYNVDDVTLEASKIELVDNVEMPKLKKMKGKTIPREDFNAKMVKYIKEQIEGKRNPYWTIRY